MLVEFSPSQLQQSDTEGIYLKMYFWHENPQCCTLKPEA